MMNNNVNLGNNNKIKGSNISGGNVIIQEKKEKITFLRWVLDNLATILAAAISGAVGAFVSWLITFLCMK